MRPSDNYENTDEVLFASNEPDIEMGNLHHHNHQHPQRQQEEDGIKGRRVRKALKGVENGGFQQEAGSLNKQSESELYFGDVSSCCGPESSFYDLAVDKETQSSKKNERKNEIKNVQVCFFQRFWKHLICFFSRGRSSGRSDRVSLEQSVQQTASIDKASSPTAASRLGPQSRYVGWSDGRKLFASEQHLRGRRTVLEKFVNSRSLLSSGRPVRSDRATNALHVLQSEKHWGAAARAWHSFSLAGLAGLSEWKFERAANGHGRDRRIGRFLDRSFEPGK